MLFYASTISTHGLIICLNQKWQFFLCMTLVMLRWRNLTICDCAFEIPPMVGFGPLAVFFAIDGCDCHLNCRNIV